jgi:hypothetical protein
MSLERTYLCLKWLTEILSLFDLAHIRILGWPILGCDTSPVQHLEGYVPVLRVLLCLTLCFTAFCRCDSAVVWCGGFLVSMKTSFVSFYFLFCCFQGVAKKNV